MLTDIFKGGWGKGDDITPSHSKIHALTPLLSVSTLTSSFSAALFPPKNKCDTILTLLSVSPKNMACLITPGRLVTPSRWSHHFFPKTRMPSPRGRFGCKYPMLSPFFLHCQSYQGYWQSIPGMELTPPPGLGTLRKATC